MRWIHLPINDYKTIPKSENHYCYQEARLSTIETKLATKTEHLHDVDEDYYHLRDKLEAININVAELTTIMKANQQKEIENDKRIDELQVELAKINSSIDTMKWLIPVACTILTFIINYLI